MNKLSRKFEENFTSDEHEETSALDDDSIVLPNNVKSNENENNVELGGDYEHWLNLWREMFCSEGWEGSPEGRLKYKYIMKKMVEAKKNGFAKEEKKITIIGGSYGEKNLQVMKVGTNF